MLKTMMTIFTEKGYDFMFMFILKLLKEYEGFQFYFTEYTYSNEGRKIERKEMYLTSEISDAMHFLHNNCCNMHLIDYQIKKRSLYIEFCFECDY